MGPAPFKPIFPDLPEPPESYEPPWIVEVEPDPPTLAVSGVGLELLLLLAGEFGPLQRGEQV
jgi:hypothetical protein